MEKVPNPGQPDPRGDLIETAVRAISAFGPRIRRDKAEQLLPTWAHVAELTDREREHVLNAFGGPRLTTDVPCTEWCTVDHDKVYEDFVRTCSSPEISVPALNSMGKVDTDIDDRPRTLVVCLVRHIELEEQQVGPTLVAVGDEYVSLKDAETLAELIYVLPALEGEWKPLT